VPLAGCVGLRPYERAIATVPASQIVRIAAPWGPQRVRVQRWGNRTSPPVVVLHGFGASSDSWRRVAPLLADRFHVAAIDLNGFGYTERPRAAEAYALEGQGKLVLKALDALDLRRVHLAGHSYGGGLALWLAQQAPSRVRTLVLFGATHPQWAETRRRPAARIRPLVAASVRGVYLKDPYVRAALERNFYADDQVTDDLLRSYTAPLRVEGVVRAYQALTAPRRDAPAAIRAFDFAATVQPTLVVWGEDDVTTPLEPARADIARIPDARLVVLPDCGHIPMEERPAESAEAMRRFFDSLPTG
jgi:pimeloyl-ACP methyl ester carboxylesterase